MVNVVPYLSVKNTIEALEFYKTVFNAEVMNRLPVEENQASFFGLSEDVDLSKTTMHASFRIDDQILYIADNFSGKILGDTNVSITIEPDNLDMMKSIYSRAKENGCKVGLELGKQSWGDYYCDFVDPFGIRWSMNFGSEE